MKSLSQEYERMKYDCRYAASRNMMATSDGDIVIFLREVRKIAADWHGGQFSMLYSLSSSGEYIPEKYQEYISEIDLCLEECKETVDSDFNLKKYELKQLKHWIEYKNREHERDLKYGNILRKGIQSDGKGVDNGTKTKYIGI